MRFKHILEATINRSQYEVDGHEMKFSGGVDGENLKAAVRVAAPDFNVDAVLTRSMEPAGTMIRVGKSDYTLTLTDNQNHTITLIGAASTIGSGMNHIGSGVKIANRGEISEGILGAAMTAKFAARNKDGIGQVSQADVEAVLNALRDSGQDEYTAMLKGKDEQFVDSLVFVLRLKSAPFADLMDSSKRNMLQQEFNSAIKYVNSTAATRYASYFYQNNKADMVKVISDGVSDETGRKTDVYVTAESPIGSPAKELKSLDISLKAGAVKQFGQVGGTSFESMTKLFGAFKIDITPVEDEYNRLAATDVMLAVKAVYEYVTNWIKTNLSSTKREAQVLTNFIDGIDFYASLNKPNVRMVHFNNGDFEILDFKKLYKVADAYDFDARLVMAGKAGNLPQIQIFDVTSGEAFLTIRTKGENKKDGMYIRNYVEKEELLAKLTRTQY